MCHECPKIPAGDIQQVMQHIQKEFEANEDLNQGLFDICIEAENLYRSVGIQYHCTQQAARHSTHFSEQSLNMLKQAFETSRVEEYNAIFARWSEFHNDLTDLARIRFKNGSTVSEMWHRLKAEYEPALVYLFTETKEAYKELENLEDEVKALTNVSLHHNDVDQYGHRFRWCDLDPNFNIPYRMGQEWQTYRTWVWSLPETQRAVGTSRRVDDIALEMLYSQPDELVEG